MGFMILVFFELDMRTAVVGGDTEDLTILPDALGRGSESEDQDKIKSALRQRQWKDFLVALL